MSPYSVFGLIKFRLGASLIKSCRPSKRHRFSRLDHYGVHFLKPSEMKSAILKSSEYANGNIFWRVTNLKEGEWDVIEQSSSVVRPAKEIQYDLNFKFSFKVYEKLCHEKRRHPWLYKATLSLNAATGWGK